MRPQDSSTQASEADLLEQWAPAVDDDEDEGVSPDLDLHLNEADSADVADQLRRVPLDDEPR